MLISFCKILTLRPPLFEKNVNNQFDLLKKKKVPNSNSFLSLFFILVVKWPLVYVMSEIILDFLFQIKGLTGKKDVIVILCQ